MLLSWRRLFCVGFPVYKKTKLYISELWSRHSTGTGDDTNSQESEIIYWGRACAKRVTSMRITDEADRIVGESSVKNFSYNLPCTKFKFFLLYAVLCLIMTSCILCDVFHHGLQRLHVMCGGCLSWTPSNHTEGFESKLIIYLAQLNLCNSLSVPTISQYCKSTYISILKYFLQISYTS